MSELMLLEAPGPAMALSRCGRVGLEGNDSARLELTLNGVFLSLSRAGIENRPSDATRRSTTATRGGASCGCEHVLEKIIVQRGRRSRWAIR